ncbi:MAG TPA: SCO family protein [Nitrospirota bacterium]|nr:SCO family protein [Nitrospirota bacterium]
MSFRWTVPIMSFLLIGSCLTAEATAESKPSYTRTVENYQIPDVTLINQDGARIKLRDYLVYDGPVLVDFVFTTCTTICPVLSSNFMNFQKTIIAESGKARLVSISVDPDFDTPKEMKAYLKRYQAKPGWDFLSGSRTDIDRVLRAFNVFTRDKMDHPPVILLKAPTDSRWVRIYGLIGTNKLLVEYEKVRQ